MKCDGLPRSSHSKKTIGSPQLLKRIQYEVQKTVVLEKINDLHFAISEKAIILLPRKHTKIFAKLSIYKIYYKK